MVGLVFVLVYLVCGIFFFFIFCVFGELVFYCFLSGSFVFYVREFFGEKVVYVVGWMYFVNWVMIGIVDIIVVVLYMYYWGVFGDVLQWVFVFGVLVIVGIMNMIGVKWFVEMEFWFVLVKVLVIVVFFVVGIIFFGLGKLLDGNVIGFYLIIDNGGFFLYGFLLVLVLVQGVVFVFVFIELVGIVVGECKDLEIMVLKVINSVIWCIGLFYVGLVVLLVLFLLWNVYQVGQSLFVIFFLKLGVLYIGSVMNIVVLIVVFFSFNLGFYSIGCILCLMLMGGFVLKFMLKMSCYYVFYVGILVMLGVYVVGVFFNYLVLFQVFEIVFNVVLLGIIVFWGFIVVCQMCLCKVIKEGKVVKVSFRMLGVLFIFWLMLLFLFSVLVLMVFDYLNGIYIIGLILLLVVLLVVGWFGVCKCVYEIYSMVLMLRK